MSPANNYPENDPRHPSKPDTVDVSGAKASGNADGAEIHQPVTASGFAVVSDGDAFPSDADFERAIAEQAEQAKQSGDRVTVDDDRAGPVAEVSTRTRLITAAKWIVFAVQVISALFAAPAIVHQIQVWLAGMHFSWMDLGQMVWSVILTLLFWLL